MYLHASISSKFQTLTEGRESGVSVKSMTSDLPQYSFETALSDALNTHRRTTAEVGRMAGVSPSMVSHWATGRNVPSPEQVFAIEDGMGLEPGELSKHLGYLPNKAEGRPLTVTVVEAIRTDPRLSRNPRLQKSVLDLYHHHATLAEELEEQ